MLTMSISLHIINLALCDCGATGPSVVKQCESQVAEMVQTGDMKGGPAMGGIEKLAGVVDMDSLALRLFL